MAHDAWRTTHDTAHLSRQVVGHCGGGMRVLEESNANGGGRGRGGGGGASGGGMALTGPARKASAVIGASPMKVLRDDGRCGTYGSGVISTTERRKNGAGPTEGTVSECERRGVSREDRSLARLACSRCERVELLLLRRASMGEGVPRDHRSEWRRVAREDLANVAAPPWLFATRDSPLLAASMSVTASRLETVCLVDGCDCVEIGNGLPCRWV